MFMATLIAGRAGFLYSPSEADSDIEAVIGPVHCTGPGLLTVLHHKCLPVVLCVRYTQATYKRKIFAPFLASLMAWCTGKKIWARSYKTARAQHARKYSHYTELPLSDQCGKARILWWSHGWVRHTSYSTSRALFCQQPKFHDSFSYACWWCKARVAIFCVLPCCANALGWLRAAPASNGVPHCPRFHPQSIHGVASNEARNPPSGQILGPGVLEVPRLWAHGCDASISRLFQRQSRMAPRWRPLPQHYGFPLSRCTEAHWRLSDVWTSTCKEALFLNGFWTCLLLAMHSFLFLTTEHRFESTNNPWYQQLWLLCVAKPCLWRSPVYMNQWHWPRKRSLTA